MAGGECAKCKIFFTSQTAFDLHLGKLIQGEGYEHLAPQDCGLHETARGWSLPPPMRPLTRDEWDGIFRKEPDAIP